MKLRIRKGAIVAFTLTYPEEMRAIGRVIDIKEDEVVIIEQAYVFKEDHDPRTSGEIDPCITVDVGSEIHIDRTLIVMWQYAFVPRKGCFIDLVNPSKLDKYTVNKIDEDGLCRGSGDPLE